LVPGSCDTGGVFRVRGTHIIGMTPLCRYINTRISKKISFVAILAARTLQSRHQQVGTIVMELCSNDIWQDCIIQ